VCLLPIEVVPPRKKRLSPKILILVLILLAAFAFIPMLRSALRSGVGIAAGAVYVVAYLFAVVMLPLMFFALARFAYSVFLRPYLRAWHINRIRNARYMKDVIRRSRHPGSQE
jgi:membrane protein implicated in regulation of membrane protease activity